MLVASGKKNKKQQQSDKEKERWAEAFSKAILGEETPVQKPRPIQKPVQPVRPMQVRTPSVRVSTEGVASGAEGGFGGEGDRRKAAQPSVHEGPECIMPQQKAVPHSRPAAETGKAVARRNAPEDWTRVIVLGEALARPRCRHPYGGMRAKD